MKHSSALFNLLSRGRRKAPAYELSQKPKAENPIETLGQLKGLCDEGLISEDEYEAKKTEILTGK